MNDLLQADVDGAAVLHSAPRQQKCVTVLFGGLGTTKEKLAWGRRRKVFEAAGHAVVVADHYNEGARRAASGEAETNRGGWSKCQKDLFWRAIHNTAHYDVPKLVDWAIATYGSNVLLFGFGSSMGGDLLLASLLVERRLCAVTLERASPDWLRPGSTGNVLGESVEGDSLYERHCPCNRVSDYVNHPTAVQFLCGEADRHVPLHSAQTFADTVRRLRATSGRGIMRSDAHHADHRHLRMVVSVLPSGGWLGHVLRDAADATARSLAFFQMWAAAAASAPKEPPPPPASLPRCVTSTAELSVLLDLSASRFVCLFATADWCTPCKRLLPGWKGLAEPDGESHGLFAHRVHFAMADLTSEADEDLGRADDDGQAATISELLQITTLPTFLLIKGRSEVARAEGAAHKRPARRLFAMLKGALD